MAAYQRKPFDLLEEGRKVREQQAGPIDPIKEARDLVSQTVLCNVLLALSDCGFYEYLRERPVFEIASAASDLGVHQDTLEHFVSYLTGCGLFSHRDARFEVTEKGARHFNSYTRGAVNIYVGAYKEILARLPEILGNKMPLTDRRLDRSTRHAAAGTAWLACESDPESC